MWGYLRVGFGRVWVRGTLGRFLVGKGFSIRGFVGGTGGTGTIVYTYILEDISRIILVQYRKKTDIDRQSFIRFFNQTS
jgi:hypothetical protein